MFRLVSNIVVFIAIVMWSIIILTFLVITIYNKVTGKAIKKSDKTTTQDLTVQSHATTNNIDYEEVRKKDVENIVNSESSDNSEKNCKTENNKPKSNKSKSTLIL